MSNILYFVSKYLKRTFEKMSHDVGLIKYGSGIKYFSNTVQHVQCFASNDLNRTFEKMSHEIRSIKYYPDLKHSLNTIQ